MSVSLSAGVTAANVYDNQVYPETTSPLSYVIIGKTHYMVADPGYDYHSLYDLSMDLGFSLYVQYPDTETHQNKDCNWLISMNLH